MEEAVVERPKQKSVTLSDRLIADYTIVARWKGIPLAKLLSQRLEADHESPEFAELLKRANAEAPGEEAAGND
jgi:hypothetical protein